LKLKEKTHKKFVEFFNEKSQSNQEKEFEMAFSEIQRSTGTASVTLKRALAKLVEDGFIAMVPGRNSRYAKFTVLSTVAKEPSVSGQASLEQLQWSSVDQEIDLLKRRVRGQEISIALLQDRLAELEEKQKRIN
jgi:DNA-binding MarR family transcriptional regulator